MRTQARLLVISPHCDDAVFSCGQLLAAHPGAVVVTVFAGRPPAALPLPEWDRAAGFQEGDDVMGVRRAEDAAALRILQAQPLWLDFCDSQYQCSPRAEAVTQALSDVMRATPHEAALFPLGLFHSDHQLTYAACAPLVRHYPSSRWFLYEDALYRRLPGLVEQQLRRCAAAGLQLHPASLTLCTDGARKREAVQCYRSQLRALTTPGRPGYLDVFTPERFWQVTLQERSPGPD